MPGTANLPLQPQRQTSGVQSPNGTTVETNNILSQPKGPEHQLLVGEGTYELRNIIQLAIPLPHPTDAPQHNHNPLATSIGPPTAGAKLSLLGLTANTLPVHTLWRDSVSGSSWSIARSGLHDDAAEQQTEQSGSSRRSDATDLPGASNAFAVPTFGEGNVALNPVGGKDAKDPTKRRKPKNNIVKSNSTFISRVLPHESLSKKLQERQPDELFCFVNVNRAFEWLDLSSETLAEPLTKILFTKAHALCHDVNPVTKSATHIDIVMGFPTGDLIWYEPMSQKYARLNKNGVINASAVASIYWIPNSESLFLAAHMDGTLIVYDKEKEDALFVPDNELDDGEEAKPAGLDTGTGSRRALKVLKSVQSHNQKANPVAVWKVSNQRINGISFSPDAQHLAVVSEDGTLRVIDYLEEKLLDVYRSYYGGMLCVCWSPDGRYIVTGGQDDLVSIWSLADGVLVARCQGHNSWVTAVAFDAWRCDDRNYRFGSVGDDCRLLLWDFNVSMLHRPRAASIRPVGSVSGPAGRGQGDATRMGSLAGFSEREDSEDDEIVHAVEPRAKVPMLPPVMAKEVDNHPLSWLQFGHDFIMTACRGGHLRTWNRPRDAGQQDGSDEGASVNDSSNT